MIFARPQPVEYDMPGIIARCLSGDKSAWDSLVDRYGRLVYSIPRGYGFCQADADDVFQNVFTLLYRRMTTIRDPMRLSTWLITAARRESWRLQRERGRRRALNDRCCDPSDPAPVLAAKWEQQQMVRDALNCLTPRERELMTALFLAPGHHEYSEIARKLSIKPGSIGPTRARCFRKLERRLN